MRGVVSAGMATGLEALGLRDAFDVVYGSSAGACAGAYFLAGQARAGARVYFEVINNRAFIDWLRCLRGRPIVDLDLLFDRVLREQLPLDFAALQASGVDLVVLASHVDEAHDGQETIVEPTCFSDFEDVDDLLGALHAGADTDLRRRARRVSWRALLGRRHHPTDSHPHGHRRWLHPRAGAVDAATRSAPTPLRPDRQAAGGPAHRRRQPGARLRPPHRLRAVRHDLSARSTPATRPPMARHTSPASTCRPRRGPSIASSFGAITCRPGARAGGDVVLATFGRARRPPERGSDRRGRAGPAARCPPRRAPGDDGRPAGRKDAAWWDDFWVGRSPPLDGCSPVVGPRKRPSVCSGRRLLGWRRASGSGCSTWAAVTAT